MIPLEGEPMNRHFLMVAACALLVGLGCDKSRTPEGAFKVYWAARIKNDQKAMYETYTQEDRTARPFAEFAKRGTTTTQLERYWDAGLKYATADIVSSREEDGLTILTIKTKTVDIIEIEKQVENELKSKSNVVVATEIEAAVLKRIFSGKFPVSEWFGEAVLRSENGKFRVLGNFAWSKKAEEFQRSLEKANDSELAALNASWTDLLKEARKRHVQEDRIKAFEKSIDPILYRPYLRFTVKRRYSANGREHIEYFVKNTGTRTVAEMGAVGYLLDQDGKPIGETLTVGLPKNLKPNYEGEASLSYDEPDPKLGSRRMIHLELKSVRFE